MNTILALTAGGFGTVSRLRYRLVALVVAGLCAFGCGPTQAAAPGKDGIVKVRSGYSHEETIERLKKDIEGKGIRFFDLVRQSQLAAEAGVAVRPSTLLIFGNPPLGAQFLTANPLAGLDWPVRLLVYTNDKGQVWMAYTDFGYIARRHRIRTRAGAFNKASAVIASIVSAAAPKAQISAALRN